MTAECHRLSSANGRVQFAYGAHTAPWHRLGTPMEAQDLTIEKMLEAAQADYTVTVRPLIVADENGEPLRNPDGSFVTVNDSRATVAEKVEHDPEFGDLVTYRGLSTVGLRYTVGQHRDLLERAFAIVAASEGEAIVDTLGIMDDGRRFFATIDLRSLVIDAVDGDAVHSYLNLHTSHDGKSTISIANTNIRTVCNNTVQMAIQSASRIFKARHTRNGVDFDIDTAREVLALSVEWAQAFREEAQKLAAIEVTSDDVTTVLNELWPLEKDPTDRQRKAHAKVTDSVREVIANERNMGGFGSTGWALWNGVVEYLDHYRPIKGKDKSLTAQMAERAAASMLSDSWVNQKKETAQGLILALA